VLSLLSRFCSLVKFEHTVFALPFALTGAFLAAGGVPQAQQLFWILAAMVGARSSAMAFNRMTDLPFDRINPRSRGWPLVSGELSLGQARLFFAAMVGLFLLSAAMLNRLTLLLAPLALAVILGYSYTKRFTSFCHFFLGLALAGAPLGGWLAVRPEWHPAPLILAGGVLLWVAGFDILYACQDVDFDQRVGLYSVPARIGVGRALLLARLLHVVMIGLLTAVGFLLSMGALYAAGVTAAALILLAEHRLVRADDLSSLNAAFFAANGMVSVVLFVAVTMDLVLFPA
jgi:4-hydroxybenzoate polyprenyltransferase